METTTFFTINEVAKILKVDTQVVRRYINTKKLKAIQFSHMGDWRVTSVDLAQFITDSAKLTEKSIKEKKVDPDRYKKLGKNLSKKLKKLWKDPEFRKQQARSRVAYWQKELEK